MTFSYTPTPQDKKNMIKATLQANSPSLLTFRIIFSLFFILHLSFILVRFLTVAPLIVILIEIFTSPWVWLALLSQIFFSYSFLAWLRYRQLLKSGAQLPGLPLTFNIEENGVSVYTDNHLSSCYSYSCFTRTKLKHGFLLVFSQRMPLIAIPTRCFSSSFAAKEAEQAILRGMTNAQRGLQPPLSIPSEPAIWQFFPFINQASLRDSAYAILPHKKVLVLAKPILVGILLACIVAIILDLSSFPIATVIAASIFTFLLSSFLGFFVSNKKNRTIPIIFPHFAYGPCTVSLDTSGLRFYNAYFEHRFLYCELRRVSHGTTNLIFISKTGGLAAIIPYTCIPTGQLPSLITFLQQQEVPLVF